MISHKDHQGTKITKKREVAHTPNTRLVPHYTGVMVILYKGVFSEYLTKPKKWNKIQKMAKNSVRLEMRDFNLD